MKTILRSLNFCIELISLIVLFPFGFVFKKFNLYGVNGSIWIDRGFGSDYLPYIGIIALMYCNNDNMKKINIACCAILTSIIMSTSVTYQLTAKEIIVEIPVEKLSEIHCYPVFSLSGSQAVYNGKTYKGATKLFFLRANNVNKVILREKGFFKDILSVTYNKTNLKTVI